MTIDPEKGIHWPTMITAVCSIIVWSLFFQLIVPNLPFFIRTYFPKIADEDIGYYAGYMISMFYLGQIPGSFFWGWFADHYGRRTAMICITAGNTLCIFGLGFSKNYYVSLVIRCLHGMIDGGLGVCKTIMADLSNDRNIAVGTGFLFVGSTIGGVIGPILGGYLSDANNIKPLVIHFPFLREMPYLVPISICALLQLIVLFLFIFLAEETLSQTELANKRKQKAEKDKELSQALLRGSNASIASLASPKLTEQPSYWSVFSNRSLILSVAIYGLSAFAQMSYDTIFPLLLFNKRDHGGFELDAVEESWLSTFSTLLQVFSLLITPLWSQLASYRIVVIWSTIVFAMCIFFTPLVSLCNQLPTIVQYAFIFVIGCINVPFRTVLFNLTIVLISNSTYKEFRGIALGLGQVASGIFRFVGPSLVPALFAWSTAYNKFPINSGFSFYILGIFLFITALLPLWIPKDIEHGKGSVYADSIKREQSYIEQIEGDTESVKI